MSTTIADLRKPKTPMKDVMALPPKQRIATLLQENKAEIAAALPRHISIERMVTIAQTAATTTPALLECYTPSLFGAMIKCTQLGLEPNNALGQAYLIPFKNNKQNRTDCQLVIGYRGMLELARRSGNVISFTAGHVCQADEFEWEFGLNETLRHKPAAGDRGPVTHFYSYAKLKGEGYQFLVWTADDMNNHMKTQTQSRGEYGPWKDRWIQMGEKTMCRMLFKWLPVSIEMADAAALDARAEVGGEQGLEGVLSGEYAVMDKDDPQALPEPITDVNGEIFDLELHAEKDNDPVYNKDGSFRKKAAKKQAAAKPAAEKPALNVGDQTPAENEPAEQTGDGDGDGEFSME